MKYLIYYKLLYILLFVIFLTNPIGLVHFLLQKRKAYLARQGYIEDLQYVNQTFHCIVVCIIRLLQLEED